MVNDRHVISISGAIWYEQWDHFGTHSYLYQVVGDLWKGFGGLGESLLPLSLLWPHDMFIYSIWDPQGQYGAYMFSSNFEKGLIFDINT